MATFAEQMAADITNVFHNTSEFGDASIVYHPKVGPARTITGMQTSEQDRMRKRDKVHEKQHTHERDTVSFLFHNNATTGITNPVLGDYIEWDNRQWTFQSVIARDSAGINVEFVAARISRTSF